MLLSSCKDIVTYDEEMSRKEVSVGAPEIIMVSPVTDRELSIAEGEMAQVVIIQGKNLTPVKDLSFNGIKVELNTIYAKVNEVAALIPRKLPEVETNKIILTTDQGTAEYDFNVEIPKIRIDGISHEYASAEDTVSILGDFFDIWDVNAETAKITFGSKEVEILKATATELSFEIPSDYDNVSTIPIVVSAPKINPITLSLHNPGNPVYTDEISFVNQYGAWSWNTSEYLKYNITDQDIIDNPQDYYFKYEISTELPINCTGIHFYIHFGPDHVFSWNNMILDNNGLELHTKGKWITKAFKLTDFSSQPLALDFGVNDFVVLFQPTSDINANFVMKNFRIAKL